MFNVNSNINIKDKIMEAWKKNLPDLSHEILDDCNYYCKEDTGNLIASSETASDFEAGRLVWNGQGKNGYVYAARQCYIIPTARTAVNPNATWMWPEVAKNSFLPKWTESAQKGIGRYL